MRLWSVHPGTLDRIGLIALWRETLLALAVLEGKTKGYKYHPQLQRFKHDINALYWYAWSVAHEMRERGYKPDTSKLPAMTTLPDFPSLPVNSGQLHYEQALVKQKIADRKQKSRPRLDTDEPNAVFFVAAGPIERWEKCKSS